jgi:hypothetical protein
MACAALMSHGRWMHLRICRKEGVVDLGIRVRTREEPDSADLFRLRPLSGERRKSETDSENDREPDPPHLHLDGMAGGSLADDGCPEELTALIEHDLFHYLLRTNHHC